MCSLVDRLIMRVASAKTNTCGVSHDRTEDKKENAMHKPNGLLELDVKDTLDWDQALIDTRIEVDAKDGNVTLSGSVPTYYDKVRAAEDTWTVGGVKTLQNNLLVGVAGEAVNDAQIAAGCVEALDNDRVVPKGSVTPTVTDGYVQLRGRVRNHFQRQAAEFAVEHVNGVLGIENLVATSSEPIPTDVADRINKAYQRSAIIDDSKIVVTNDGHTVVLSGVVGSYAAMREAVDTAWSAPGVDNVVNNLVIEP
jgi:osmotically-inducible protein OsmY